MTDSKITVAESGSVNLDTESLTVGANTVHRERNQVAGASALEIAAVKAATPATDAYGVVVREVVMGEVQASPTANTVLDRLKALLTGIVIATGSAIIGRVGIDQTTPGTTNKVSVGSDVVHTIIDSGASTVTGSVTANAGTNLNTSALATSAQIGEVQASPTANTVLDRLKALLTGIVISTGSAIIGRVGFDQTTDGTTNAVAVHATKGSLTDRSGTITTGGTKQTLAAANTSRKYLFIENPYALAAGTLNTAESLFINFTTDAVKSQPSIEIPIGAAFVMEGSYVSTELVSVNAATTGHAFVAKEG